jgi:copper chaperone CopZ
MSYYFHHVQGRLRVKTPFIKRSSSAAQAIKKLLGEIQGIESAEINTITGSAVIHYEPKAVSSREILNILEEAGYFDLSKAVTNDQHLYAAAAQTGGILWKALAGVLIEQAFQGSALSFLAVLI